MKSVLKVSLAATAILCLSGFISSRFSVTVDTATAAPVFTLVSNNPLKSKDSGILLESFTVFGKKDGKWDYQHAKWMITSKEPILVKRITYGVLPEGFYEVIPASELSKKMEYSVLASGPGSIGGEGFVLP